MDAFEQFENGPGRENPFWHTFVQDAHHMVISEAFVREIYNYVIKGFEPGSFHKALLANDLMLAVCSTHPANNWEDICSFVRWFQFRAPAQCWKSMERVEAWIKLPDEEREKVLEAHNLLFTTEKAVWFELNRS